jgi:CheY-like chemotaxis protein
MIMTEHSLQEIPDEFIEDVKTALENLYDFPSLQRHALIRRLPNNSSESPVPHLRRLLTEAIESLKPQMSVSVRSSAGRIYHLLHLHYVGGMALAETAQELGLSLRQIYRDLRRGQENVSTILWYQLEHDTPVDSLSTVEAEVARLDGELSPVNLHMLLETAVKAVQKLAERIGTVIELHLDDKPLIISTNAAIAQQVIINLISQSLQQLQPQRLEIRIEGHPQIRILAMNIATKDINLDPVISQLLSQLHWTTQEQHKADSWMQVIRLRREGTSLLLIDDNEGLTDLLSRYLAAPHYRCIVAHRGEEGLHLAQELLPDAILMDLMMPGMDGWELLQRLRMIPETSKIPVIICSVINDPELAYSLGASAFVSKPVEKETLLGVLRGLKID